MAADTHWHQGFLVAVLLLCFGQFSTGTAQSAQKTPLRIYLDADRQTHRAAAVSIELGVRAAFEEFNNEIAGYPIEFVPLDHRGNVKRSRLNIQKYIDDPQALALFGGLHSTPYLKYQSFINDNRVLTLLPWSAAGPLTRVASGENWIFRLSVDDTKAAKRMVSHAVGTLGCERPALLLWDSGWGRTNEVTLTQALTERSIEDTPVFYFPGSLEKADSDALAYKLTEVKADCALLIANTREGASVVSSISELEYPVTVVSHWGITGGDFTERVKVEARERVNLQFLQTCYPSRDAINSDTDRVWQIARQTAANPDLHLSDLRAPAGFFHGYDLARLLIEALGKHPGIEEPDDLRHHVHSTLESLEQPVVGLVRTYERPFEPFSTARPDAHEALGLDDLCMARFDRDGGINILSRDAAAIAGRE